MKYFLDKTKKYYCYVWVRKNIDSAGFEPGTPRYAGKGTGNRAYDWHTKYLPTPKKDAVRFVDNKLNFKSQPILYTEEQAFKLERRVIKKYGRRDLKTGCLLNMNSGGSQPPRLSDLSLEKQLEKKKKHSYTLEKFLKKLNTNLELISKFEFVCGREIVETRCKICNYIIVKKAKKFYKGTHCCRRCCYKKLKKLTPDYYKKVIHENYELVNFLGKTERKIDLKCKKCNKTRSYARLGPIKQGNWLCSCNPIIKKIRSERQKRNWRQHKETMMLGLKKSMTATKKENISIALKNSDACKLNGLRNRKKIYYKGSIFNSRKEAALYYNIDRSHFNYVMEKYPMQCYYI